MLLSLGVDLGLPARVQLDVAHPAVVRQHGGDEEPIRSARKVKKWNDNIRSLSSITLHNWLIESVACSSL